MIFAGVRIVPVGKLFEKKCGWPPAWQWTNLAPPNVRYWVAGEQRKTFAHTEFFSV
jgi:hypothetical protein